MQEHHPANGPEGLPAHTASTPAETDWTTVNWRKVNRQVRNLRRRIYRASQAGDHKRVHRLQKLMLRSYSNRLQAVRRVTQQNQGRNTPGVDKVVVKTPKARGALVDDLGTFQPWRAHPVRRVYIPKQNGKLRPLGILTVRDRALQAMVKTAWEPAWEARFEPTSYGFRPGRSCHDAMAMIYKCARVGTRRPWVVDADIEAAYDHLDHQYLLDAIGPAPGRELIRQWLKAGVMEHGTVIPTWEGAAQGGVISPLLLNVAMQGLEEALGIRWHRQADGHHRNGTGRALVRYADDLVVFCRTKEDAETTIDILHSWLADRGLSLSVEKTRIVHLSEGFDFLGFTVRRYRTTSRTAGEILLIRPSRESLRAFRARLRQEWLSLHGRNAATVVKRLNPLIKGWGNYFRVCNVGQEFKKLDRFMYHRALRFGLRQHPNKGKRWIVARYFGQYHPTRKDRWVFGDKDSGRYLWKLSWTNAMRHTVVAYRASPDDATLAAYWDHRAKAKLRTLTPSRQKIAMRQNGRCPVCGEHLMNEEDLQTHHLQPRRAQGGDAYDNLRLVHLYCHQQADRQTHEEWDAE